MNPTMMTALDYEQCSVLVQALKHFEHFGGETDTTRLLVARLRRMRDEITPPDAPNDAKTQADIFAAAS